MSLGEAVFWIGVETVVFMGVMYWLYRVQLRFWRRYFSHSAGVPQK